MREGDQICTCLLKTHPQDTSGCFVSLESSSCLCVTSSRPSPAVTCRLMLFWTKSLRPSKPWVNRYSRYQVHGLDCWKTHRESHQKASEGLTDQRNMTPVRQDYMWSLKWAENGKRDSFLPWWNWGPCPFCPANTDKERTLIFSDRNRWEISQDRCSNLQVAHTPKKRWMCIIKHLKGQPLIIKCPYRWMHHLWRIH